MSRLRSFEYVLAAQDRVWWIPRLCKYRHSVLICEVSIESYIYRVVLYTICVYYCQLSVAKELYIFPFHPTINISQSGANINMDSLRVRVPGQPSLT